MRSAHSGVAPRACHVGSVARSANSITTQPRPAGKAMTAGASPARNRISALVGRAISGTLAAPARPSNASRSLSAVEPVFHGPPARFPLLLRSVPSNGANAWSSVSTRIPAHNTPPSPTQSATRFASAAEGRAVRSATKPPAASGSAAINAGRTARTATARSSLCKAAAR